MRTVAVALGGGGARTLAQIPVLEALDEMGVKPVALSGASFGAVIGAAYASGLSGRTLRRLVIAMAHDRTQVYGRLLASRAGGLSAWLASPLGNPLLLDSERFCEGFLPPQIPEDFSELQIPVKIVATDLYARGEAVLTSGPLRSAIAASIAVPGLMRPVERDGRILVDGAAVNPLPFDLLRGEADLIVAVDASIGPSEPRGVPEPWEALFATVQVVGHGLVTRKMEEGPPDLLIQPTAGVFRLFDFFRASAIMRAADPVKAQVKERLGALLG